MQVPSLMSLGNNYSGPGPNYANQQNYSSGRFNDRSARHPMKNQRPQPYNKVSDFDKICDAFFFLQGKVIFRYL